MQAIVGSRLPKDGKSHWAISAAFLRLPDQRQADVTGDLDEASANEKSGALVPGAGETACRADDLARDGQSV